MRLGCTITSHLSAYCEGERAALDAVDRGIDHVCPYAYTGYTDTPYRAWMAGYWKIMHEAMGPP